MISLLLHKPRLRALARRVGLTGVGYKLIPNTYGDSSKSEAKFAKALIETVHPGDCIWDVGANVGHYTLQLAQRVGQQGCVVAFEPFDLAFRQLASATSAFSQVRCLRLALGAHDHDLQIVPSQHGPGCTLIEQNLSGQRETIHVTTGTKLILDGIPTPAVLKIDVEGFEEDVVWGMREALRNATCRNVFVEVHYGLLEQRGYLRAPSRLISLLEDLGFRTRWLDLAHLIAGRE